MHIGIRICQARAIDAMDNIKTKKIIEELRSYLMNRAVWLLGNDFRLAEDVVHDVIFSLIKDKERYGAIINLKAYSSKMLVNAIARRKAEEGKMVGIENANLDHNLSFSYTMDAARQWAEMIDFDTILEQLGEADAGMVRMKYKSNMTNVAIAKELKMSEAGVRKRMATAHENIKEIIMKMIDNYEQ